MKLYYLYILECNDGSYYTGVTNNLEKRFAEHQSDENPKSYVYNRRPLKLIWSEYYNDINQAIEKEKQVKGWSKKKKEALIKDDFDSLIELSKNSILREQNEIVQEKKYTLRQAQDDTFFRKVVITGPESSGKTTLTKLLAQKHNAPFVKEYARKYLTLRQAQGDNSYNLEDVLKMGKEQLKQEENASEQLVFLDTDLTVYAVWIKEKYNLEIDWITAHLKTTKDKLYLLCDVNIDWEEDKLREHPNILDRKRLFQEYINLLEKYHLPYHVISGNIPSRIKKVNEIINQLN